MKPMFSVIIPALNEEKFLPNLLESLVKQSERNFEVIMVDGSSTDGTVEKAKQFKKKLPALEIVVSEKASLPLQRNLGAKHATGEWLVFVDADSVLMPYFIERAHRYIERKNPNVFTSWFQPDSDENKDGMFTLLSNLYIETTLHFKRPLTPGPLTVIKSSVYHELGGYDEHHAFNEDAEFGLRAYMHGNPMHIIREVLYTWSMRRLRHEGKMKVLQQYVLSVLPIIFLKKPLKSMPGYAMGGQLYSQQKRKKYTSLKEYEEKLKKILSDLFE